MTRARLVGAIRLADHYGLIPPDHGGLYGVGETLSYASQRLVDRPSAFSLADLKGCSSHTQITHQACEEGGGAFIAQWTGVRLSYMLDLVGVDPRARYVVFFPFDDSWDSFDMADALHPQTYLAYGMNGEYIPPPMAHRCGCAWRGSLATRASSTSRASR